MKLLAIDLSVGKNKPSGIASFEGRNFETFTALTDGEILEVAERFDVIGIDAPLSLPAGRTSLEKRQSIHFRECDLELRKRKFRFFPITIGAMRKLTKRGMVLAKALREMGKEVYELFPGAYLDLFSLPRKDVSAVNKFLEDFSVNAKNVDESDAAIGLFTLLLYKKGLGWEVSGKDGKIIMPNPAIYLGKLTKAEVIERVNRFVVKLSVNGKMINAYLRDTGALRGFLEKGNTAYITAFNGNRLRWIIKALENREGVKIAVDPKMDELLVKMWLRKEGILAGQKRIGDSVFDLVWDKCVGEVKGASLKIEGCFAFPDPYSKRAEKHVKELATFECSYLFFVSHGKVECVKINPEYPNFSKLIKESGITVKAFATTFVRDHWVMEREVPFFP